jgi:16S rRNA (cytosine967-C5)-methyltransferase
MIAATLGKIDLLATDAEEHRLPQLQENLQRAGGENVDVKLHDWTEPCPLEWQGAFDAVLLDVPCSNSGVLQRRVDARWRLQPSEFERLAVLQLRILSCAAAAVRPGGRLVYSTCSIDRSEDRAVVDAFLSQNPEFTFERDYLALPHIERADGAYAALLRRK